MPDNPKVSVVVLNHNGLHHLEECFSSLLDLTYPSEKVELILVDNASKKSPSALMAEKFPSVKVIQNDVNYGFARGSDIGAKAATGDYVAFLNNDTRAHPDWLTRLVEAIDEEKGVVCVGSRILNWEGDAIDFIGAQLNFYGHGFQEAFKSNDIDKYKDEKRILFACGGAMLINREVFLNTGGFDEDYFAFFEDVDLGWRLWVLGYQVKLVPASIVYHKHHGTAAKFPVEWRYVMYERNALYTIIKNYNQENLDKILPVALLLSVKRAMEHAGIDRSEYYAEKSSMPLSETQGGGAAASQREPEPTRVDRLKTAYQEEGLWGTFMKLARRMWGVFTMYVFLRRPPKGADFVSRLTVGHFVALDEVASGLPKAWAKREKIQNLRRRSDEEVLALFGAPLRANCLTDDYLDAQTALVKLFNIGAAFGVESD